MPPETHVTRSKSVLRWVLAEFAKLEILKQISLHLLYVYICVFCSRGVIQFLQYLKCLWYHCDELHWSTLHVLLPGS